MICILQITHHPRSATISNSKWTYGVKSSVASELNWFSLYVWSQEKRNRFTYQRRLKPGLKFKLFARQTPLLVMPRWINNGWLRRAEKKLIRDGNKCFTMNWGESGLTLSWRSRQVLIRERFQNLRRRSPAAPQDRRQGCRTSSWPTISVAFSIFLLPLNFLLFVLVSCCCSSGHCSLTIPAKVSWSEEKVFGNFLQNDRHRQTEKVSVCACAAFLHFLH